MQYALGCSAYFALLLTQPAVADTPGSDPWMALPKIPSGAVYFRKSGPPSEDWPRDYKQAAADGMNAFRHWFPWSSIEISPGK